MERDHRGGVGLLCEAGRGLRGPGSCVAHFCSTVTRPLLPASPSPRSPWPPDVCARGLLSRALKGSLVMVPRLGPSVSSAPCLQVTAPQFECPHFSYVALCVFLVVCCNRSVLAEIPPLLTVRILKCPATADVTCSLMPARASPSGICTFHTAGRGLLRENVLCCIESSEK